MHLTLLLAVFVFLLATSAYGAPRVRVDTDPTRAALPFLSWDTETGRRVATNLLRKDSHVGLRVRTAGQWRNCSELPARVVRRDAEATTYVVPVSPAAEVQWTVSGSDDHLALSVSLAGEPAAIESLDLHVPFDPGVTPTCVIPQAFADDGSMRLPALLHAPDFGTMLLTGDGVASARLEGSRSGKSTTFIIEFRPPTPGKPIALRLEPVAIEQPTGLADAGMWTRVRGPWLNALQPSSRWGDQNNPFSAPPGILANNVISDPASCSLWFYADQAFFTPTIAKVDGVEISAMALVRRSVDWWLDHRMRPTGEMVCYWDYTNFLDANAGPLIAAWDYVEGTGDAKWLAGRIAQLEKVAEFLASRDVDGDGLIEATQPGTPNSLQEPARSCAWWDALNCGHKDAYTNALIYRAFRCLADLESKLGRRDPQQRYAKLADALKKSYFPALFNPATGWLAWWKDRDGALHDYAAPTVNGLAIEYGLVPDDAAREILSRLHVKMKQVGFTRFDFGLPSTLVPVPRSDYLQPNAIGCPNKEDGTDTFGHYMNGGISAGHTLHFLAAHYRLGDPGPADEILHAMLKRQAEVGFHNGVRDTGGQGIDWTDWNGNANGYEGYLADSFRFLQAALLREKTFRDRFYRPLID